MSELDEIRDRCSRFVNWHGNRSAAEFLAELPPEIQMDRYGAGGIVESLEADVCSLLGKEAAVFMPSGTMAQQAALRIHSDRRGSRRIAFHPTSHIELHEDKAYQRLHDLIGVGIGDARALITLDDIATEGEAIAAVLFELPQREIGGRLPEWSDLQAQVARVRERGSAVHLDGARLWECTPYYQRSLDEIAGLFDTVYVSFYKGLGGLGGCCLAGEADVIAEARAWRHRHGGTLWALWPLAASALAGLRMRLPKMPAYYEHARAIARALRGLDGIEVVPDPPQVSMMHLHLTVSAGHFAAQAKALAEEEGIWTWNRSFPGDAPSKQLVELTVGDATLGFEPDEIARIVERLVR